MTVFDIQILISRYFLNKGHKYICSNFLGAGYHEADILSITKYDYSIECEIKISRNDFKADSKKAQKHYMLETGFILGESKIPAQFYYVCEFGLIEAKDVPLYAGLILISKGKVIIEKKAPKLHKNKVDNVLIDKMLRVFTERSLFDGKSKMTYEKGKGKKVFVKYKRKHHG